MLYFNFGQIKEDIQETSNCNLIITFVRKQQNVFDV